MTVGVRKPINNATEHHSPVPSTSLECGEDYISLVDLAENSEISVLIPHSDASAYHTMVGHLPHSLPVNWRALIILMKANNHSCNL